jgi:hypothetical protein
MSIRPVGESPRIPIPESHVEPTAQKAEAPKGPSAFQRVVDGLGKELHSGERMMHTALHAGSGGESFAPSDLLALQAGVYRYSEVVDLTSKLIDRTATGLKTVLSGNGQ